MHSERLPVLPTIRDACVLPFRFIHAFLLSYGLGVAAIAAALIALVLTAKGIEQDNAFETFFRSPGWVIGLVLGCFLGFLGFLVGTFNLWLRVAVLQDKSAWRQPVRDWAGQITMNFLNLIWIGLLVAIVSWITIAIMMSGMMLLGGSVLVAIGTGDPNFLSDSTALMGIGMVLMSIPAVLFIFYIYARFSLHLVEGALGSHIQTEPRRDTMKSEAFRFSIILAGVYIAGMLLDVLLSAFELDGGVLSMMAGLYGIAVIGAAHGLVFRHNSDSEAVEMAVPSKEEGVPTLDIFVSDEKAGTEESQGTSKW